MNRQLPAIHWDAPMEDCSSCGAVVPTSRRAVHEKWHADINELFFKMGETAVDIRRLQAPGEPGE